MGADRPTRMGTDRRAVARGSWERDPVTCQGAQWVAPTAAAAAAAAVDTQATPSVLTPVLGWSETLIDSDGPCRRRGHDGRPFVAADSEWDADRRKLKTE